MNTGGTSHITSGLKAKKRIAFPFLMRGNLILLINDGSCSKYMKNKNTSKKNKVGGFAVNKENNTVTLAAGFYELEHPIIFGIDKQTKITDVFYKSPPMVSDPHANK